MKSYIKSLFNFLSYRKKLSLAFISFLVLPMFMFSFIFIRSIIAQNENQLINYNTSITERDMDNITAILNSAMLRINTLENDSRLHVNLNSIDDTLVRLVELSYYFHLLHQSLVSGEPGMMINIYRSTEHFIPEGMVKHINELDSSILADSLTLPPGAVMIRYNDDHLFFYKLNRRLNQFDFFIIEVMVPFSKIKSVFTDDRTYDIAAAYFTATGNIVELSRYEDFSFRNCYIFEYTIDQAGWIFRYNQELSFMVNALEFLPGESDFGKVVFYVNNTIYSGVPLTILLLFGLFICLVILVLFISRRLTNRLYSVIDQMQHRYVVWGGGIQIKLSYNKNDEFYMISNKLNELFDTIHEYYEDIKNISLENKELETQLLQDLISPHFLYNTLDGIKWLSDDDQVTEVVDSMIGYYRSSFNKGLLYMTIGDELNLLNEYVKLQQFAYESSFRYVVDIEPEIMEFFTIKHILQPFVENSILHGIDKIGDNGFISVKGYKKNDSIVFEVMDNGCGIDPELFDTQDGREESLLKRGYGTVNVHKRIVNLFGEQYGVRITNIIGGGVKVQIVIPVKKQL